MSIRVTILLLCACFAGCPGQKSTATGNDGAPPSNGDEVTIEALLTDRPVMQHPLQLSPPGAPKRVESYLEIEGHQTVVYAATHIRCPDGDGASAAPAEGVAVERRRTTPARVRLRGRWTSITASKFGKKGTERQFVASSWECLP